MKKVVAPLDHLPLFAGAMIIWLIVARLHGLAGLRIDAQPAPLRGGLMTAVLADLIPWAAGFLTHALAHLALNDIALHVIVVGCAVLAIVAGAAGIGRAELSGEFLRGSSS